MTINENERKELLRSIPKVDEFMEWVATESDQVQSVPIRLVKKSIRQILECRRQDILQGKLLDSERLEKEQLMREFKDVLKDNIQPNFRVVINATGVVVHTNLGRSLLPSSAMADLLKVGCHYSNLEFDLKLGKRGSRYSLVEELICELTGAEAALVVNNNAAAVLLVLETLAASQEVIVSRGQLVEIGGSFRIPEVMEKSGAHLVEVGATNRTHLVDYEKAITDQTALLLKVHTSNYKMIGFTAEVPLVEMVSLGKKYGLPVMEDLGSGCLVDLSRFGLQKEPTVGEVVASGVDVVTCSGDKLFGGPQAGLIVGKKNIIDKVKKNPLNRALRIDKFTLAGLEAVLRIYHDEEKALQAIPTLAMLSASFDILQKRARRLKRLVAKKMADCCHVAVVETESRVGGGALPEQGLRSSALQLSPMHVTVNTLEEGLRGQDLPVVGRIENDMFLLDVRTVLDEEVRDLAQCLLTFFKR